MNDATVLAKAEAASKWCSHASQVSEKPWRYLLIPHDAVGESKTIAGLAASHQYEATK